MKKYNKNLLIIVLLITNVIFITTTVVYKYKSTNSSLKIYSIKGENSDMKINDGFILLSKDKELLNGGNVEFSGNSIPNINYYSKSIFIDKHGERDTILLNSISHEGDYKVDSLRDELLANKTIGTISSETLFSNTDIDSIKDNLYFCFEYKTTNNEKKEIVVKLDVNEVNLNSVNLVSN